MDTITLLTNVGTVVALLGVPAVVALVKVWARVNSMEQKQATQELQLGELVKRLESLDQRFTNVMVELSRINVKLDILLPRHTER